MDYKFTDFLSDFGGFLGMFIGGSILYLYDISTYFILQIITKFKRRFGSDIRIKVVKIEFNENENSKILIKIQEEIEKLADMLAKDENKNKIK